MTKEEFRSQYAMLKLQENLSTNEPERQETSKKLRNLRDKYYQSLISEFEINDMINESSKEFIEKTGGKTK